MKRILIAEPADPRTASRPNPRCLPHFRSPYHTDRPESAISQIEQWLALFSKVGNPIDLSTTKIFETIDPIQDIRHYIIAILFTQPIIERSLSTCTGFFEVLT
ncbi:hypothetical protein [Nocardia fluminea]|uniref:hypothetical protein n=1 Tax=Nocardia fluminea TaxID=134984 RepID=UPI001FE6AF6E|nr:hypothetical protein [Nocardia fluminea]